MFSKAGDWVKGELDATSEEYKMLEQMNRSEGKKRKIRDSKPSKLQVEFNKRAVN